MPKPEPGRALRFGSASLRTSVPVREPESGALSAESLVLPSLSPLVVSVSRWALAWESASGMAWALGMAWA